MLKTIEAVYDGKAFLPEEPFDLEANTRVQLVKERYRFGAIRLLAALEADPDIEIVPLTRDLYARAFVLFRGRLDKEWGLTDCVSFVVMHDRGLTQALTPDAHFKQAGFQTLLLE